MRWSNHSGRRSGWPRRASLLLATLATLLLSSPAAEEPRLYVFAPNTRYQVAIMERAGKEYVGLVELLEPLGPVSGRVDGKKFKFRFKGIEAEFQDGKTQARIGKLKVELPGEAVVEADHVLIPFAAAPAVLAHFLGTHVDYHPVSRRLMIGVADVSFTAELRKSDPSALVLSFSAPVNPSISTGAGALRMVFTHDPVVSWAEKFNFNDRLVPSAVYSESAGSAVLTVHGTAPLLATFSNDGRTITVSAAPGAAPPTVAVAPPPPPVQQPAPAPAPAVQPTAPSGAYRPRFLVVIDASHGGDDDGVKLNAELAEKDVVLVLARRLRAELQNRGFNTVMLRDGDSNLDPEQRAAASNTARAAVYISLHADVLGTGVRVYTSLLPPAPSHPGPFVPWDSAQAGYLESSRIVANSILEEVARKQINVAMLPAPLSPLNHIAAAAVAVEVAPPRPDLSSLTQASYQQAVVTAIATALTQARPQLEAAR
ncbi:MAG TPA: N-acetylmuramoyl-L-alanine amidase [Terriglobales bacterium]|jgi:N-acetylmuramoyl-L-alanine amidase|nr:N-acetylmuramoyl-L-alanine amidase [Terriglobales bacterium]